MSSFLTGAQLNEYVLHAYIHPKFPEILTWRVIGRRVEAVVSHLETYPFSKILNAQDLGLDETVLSDMRTWSNLWSYHNGREDPSAAEHSPSYLEAKHRVTTLSSVIHPAVKKHFTA
jgi:hypothetical protein